MSADKCPTCHGEGEVYAEAPALLRERLERLAVERGVPLGSLITEFVEVGMLGPGTWIELQSMSVTGDPLTGEEVTRDMISGKELARRPAVGDLAGKVKPDPRGGGKR